MFDFSWAEILLIGIVSMIFIGPKDFPKVIRWFSDTLKKCRKMAGEFHNQVDEMVKDTDLKEAKDQLMELRHMNVKGVILGAIDRDGSLQDTFKNPPLSSHTALTGSGNQGFETTDINPTPYIGSAVDHTGVEEDVDNDIDVEALERDDPAPTFFPPPVAQRMQVRRASPPSPPMIPPQIAKYKEQRWL
ncbi:Sec-independent protein translocase protein TatB [Commensalibacter oyaizuii]|uniref:Sec-independent protein translocase protein TatB n=1 Tax=Commensalibacter oyaizuii TaxID=3043873 RepID=A0ABT6Q309_9PROT|nr:Sec-independent protein translocase protein TatB [Commensalibacter sp. TBRC 16381]MDI2091493.1 Sec-independent protein translocase protein TatB [Commensalibacter sp. TBRC 16381]